MNTNILMPLLGTLLGVVVTHFLSKRKMKSEVGKMQAEIDKLEAETLGRELENAKAIINMWKEAASDLTNQVKQLQLDIQSLRTENISLKEEMRKLERALELKTV